MAEFAARSLFDPVDYLLPTLVTDEMLGYRLSGHTGGHDALGFRNFKDVRAADIVCLGDSMTYGISARARDSWPSVIGSISGENVYNMGLGGYGPIQYLYLMRTRVVELQPKTVIVGFYFGNDFIDAYNIVRFNRNWSAYGTFDGSEVSGPSFVFPRRSGKILGSLRDWLARNSVLYAVSSQLPIFDFFRRREFSSRMTENANDELIVYRENQHNVIFDLSPGSRFLDMSDPRLKAGLEITKHVFIDMQSEAQKDETRLVVALIPTKERVYGSLLKKAGILENHPRLLDAIQSEDAARQVIIDFLQQHQIEAIDILPPLETEVVRGDLYPVTDPHPNKAGYRVIAETVNRYLASK
jgi:hypothetical protein